jgi:Trk K+ transport system NAD-binding subunit
VQKRDLKSKFLYRFDNLMARGLVALIGLLALASLVFVGVVSTLVVSFKLFPPGRELSFLEVFWGGLLRTLDPGTMGQDDGPGYRFAMLVITLSGVILVASLIGVISTAFNAKVEQLRKGRSHVLESDHTVILGWNSKIFHIIHEICVANESRSKAAIVILADRDKVEMEDAIRARVRNTGKTKIIVRSGDPMSALDLGITNHAEARSLLILSEDSEHADSTSIKICMALLNGQVDVPDVTRIIGEIKDPVNLEAANLVGGRSAHWVLGQELISRLIVQTSRQSGLSSVFTELLDFEDSEMYLFEDQASIGKTYGELLLSISDGCLIGFESGHEVYLNPSPETVFAPGDKLIVVARDDSHVKFGLRPEIDGGAATEVVRPSRAPEQILILGTNASIPAILEEMSNYVAPDSRVVIVDQIDATEISAFENMSIEYVVGDGTKRSVLEHLSIARFDHIVLLADKDRFGVQQADARTLLTLLHLRELSRKSGKALNIVSEMLDDHNRELAETTDADDFIVSDKLVSLMLAQLAETAELSHVFAALLSSQGSEVRLHPVEWYVKLGVPVDFNSVIAAARGHGDTAIGYRKPGNLIGKSNTDEVLLNPDRATKTVYAAGDKLVVLTND